MEGKQGERETLAQLAEALVGRSHLDRELEQDALEEIRRSGRVSYMGAARRRWLREQAVATPRVTR